MKCSILNLALVGLCLLLSSGLSSSSSAPSIFSQLGETIIGNEPSNPNNNGPTFDFGAMVQLSKNGKRLAVGAPLGQGAKGAVFVYEHHSESQQWIEIFRIQDGQLVGDLFSFSDDGQVLAVRHGNGDASVYVWDESAYSYTSMGTTVAVCNGRGLAVGRTTSSTDFGDATWLLVSCEYDNRHTGKVELMTFNETGQQWQSFTKPIAGPTFFSLFGWRTALCLPTKENRPILIATSAPSWNYKTGMVRVLAVDATGTVEPMGQDMEGETRAEQFGFGLDLSVEPGRPHLVVGAPQCSDVDNNLMYAGCVSVYQLVLTVDGYRWIMIGNPVYGIEAEDSFGRSVAINGKGNRVAASSFKHDVQRGLVVLYERNDSENDSFQPIEEFGGTRSRGRWGQSVAMDGSGSIVVSGSPRIPASNDNRGTVQVYIEDGSTIESPSSAPTVSEEYGGNGFGSDIVYDHGDVAGTSPSSFPSKSPSTSPSATPSTPSSLPSMIPTLTASHYPSMGPSESVFPSSGPSEGPTEVPTLSNFPSVAPSVSPSDSPSFRPSFLRSTPPTTEPTGWGFGSDIIHNSQDGPSAAPSNSLNDTTETVSRENQFHGGKGLVSRDSTLTTSKMVLAVASLLFIVVSTAVAIKKFGGSNNNEDADNASARLPDIITDDGVVKRYQLREISNEELDSALAGAYP